MSQLGGANSLGTAVLSVRAGQDQLAADFAKIRSMFEKNVKSIQSKYAKVSLSAKMAGGLTAGVGGVGAVAGGLGATAALAAGAKTAADFEQKMTDAAVLFGIFEKQGSAAYEKLQASAIQLGAQTAFSASQVASAFEVMGQAGFGANEAIAAMPNVLGLAAAGGMKVADAAEIATATMNNFGLATEDLERVNDSLATAANKSNVNMQDLSYSLKYTAPIAKAVGVEMEDLLAVIAKMGDAGIKGEMAGTSLRSVLSKLAAPTKEAREEFAALGIDIANFGKAGGPTLFDVLDRIQGMDAGRLAKLFDRESMAGLMGLLNKGGFRDLAGQMRDPANRGSARRMAAAKMDTAKGDFDQMAGSLESLAIAVFQPINQNLFRPAMRAATEYFEGLSAQAMNSQQQIALWAAQTRDILKQIGGGVAEAGRRGMAGVGGVGNGGFLGLGNGPMDMGKIESVTANFDLAWDKFAVKARIAIIETKALFATFITGAGEGIALLGQGMLKTFTTAVDPRNWGEGFKEKIADIWAGENMLNARRDGKRAAFAAGDAVRAEENLPAWLKAEAGINKLQADQQAEREWERKAPILERGAKMAWENVMQPFAGGGDRQPNRNQPLPVEEVGRETKKQRQSQMVGIADLAKQIQTGLMGDGKDIEKRQLKEQEAAVRELKGVREDLKKPPAPAAVV